MLAAAAETTKADAGKQKVLMVKDSSAQTTPPNSPLPRRDDRYRSQPEVAAGSKVNGPATPEFRTIVNVFDDRLRQEMDRRAVVMDTVVMDTDSTQSAAASAVNGRRDKTRRTNGVASTSDKPHNSKGTSDHRSAHTLYTMPQKRLTGYCGALDRPLRGRRFNAPPIHCHTATTGKLFTHTCDSVHQAV